MPDETKGSLFNVTSYMIGYKSGKTAGTGQIIIESGITCTDDGEANITIAEVSDNG